MKPDSLIQNILQQKESKNLLAILAAVIVAYILGRQIAAGHYTFIIMIAGFAAFLLIFIKKDSITFLLPFVLLFPNFGLDIPGPWAVTIEDAFIIALFTGYLLRSILLKEKILPRGSPIFLPFAAFIIVAYVSLYKSVQIDPDKFLINFKDLLRMTELFLLYIVLVKIIDSPEKITRMIRNLLILTSVFVVTSYFIYLTGSEFFYSILTMQPAYIHMPPHKILRMISIAGSTSQTGMFYAIILGLAIYYEPLTRTKRMKVLRVLFIIAVGSCILLSFNRGTWAGLMLGYSFLLLKGSIDWKKIALVSLVIFALAALLFVTVFSQVDIEQNALMAFDISKRSGEARWIRWVSAIDLILEHPLLGVGYNNYAWVYGQYSIQEGNVQQYGSPHNMFVDIVTGTGVIGFSIFMLFMFRLGRIINRISNCRKESIRRISTGIYFAFIIFIGASLFDSFFYKPHHTGILIIVLWSFATTLYRIDTTTPDDFSEETQADSEPEPEHARQKKR